MQRKSNTLKYLCKLLYSTTPFCQHNHSCIMNMSKGMIEAFTKAFLAKLCLNAIMLVMSSKKIIKSQQKIKLVFNILINRTNFHLGLFMGTQTFLIKCIQCLLRTIRQKEDGWNAAISGFIGGGLSFITQKPHVQNILRVYLFARATECLYQIGIQRKYYNHRKANTAIAFILMTAVIAYGFFFEPDILPMDTFKMYENFSQQTLVDQVWHMCNVQQYRNRCNV
ncbi:unnamed protein product [Paramecium sonneborni]|uniref:Peroxisomal membrane protein 4 n=1 Tax=Paramecium sonneborni TaxID=65129 RepID=A0A8S1RGY0_9CILI|nr:unnamed protein product [Paramecium sonneborni]